MEFMKTKHIFLLLSLSASLLLGACDTTSEPSRSSSDNASSDSLSSHSSSSSSASIEDYECHLYDNYYLSLTSWNNGEDLINKLHSIISSGTYKSIEYAGTNTNWMSNQEADKDIYDRERLDVVYSGDGIDPALTNTSWQREHAWPASLMTNKGTTNAVKTLGRATDFHNIFASSASGNTSRGNKNYGNANQSDSTFKDMGYSSGGYRYDSKNFEPAEKDKGRLSRAIFYMATMYNKDELNEDGTVLYPGLKVQEDYVNYDESTYTAYAIGNLSDLLSWSSSVTVDLGEYQHNESVYSYVPKTHGDETKNNAQGNRNPYVDFPGLVEYAFGSKKDKPGNLSLVSSSYETLNIASPKEDLRTIVSAKRVYEVGSVFSKDDIVVGKYGAGLSISNDANWTLEGASDGESLTSVGTKKVTIKTETNALSYSFEVKDLDPFVYSTYSYTFTGSAAGNDLNEIKDKPGVDNELTLGGVTWIINFAAGKIGSMNNTFGVAFGTSSVPVKTLTITSKEEIVVSEKTLVESMYLKGSAASGTSYDCSMYLGEELISTSKLGYEAGVAQVKSATLSAPKAGKVKFEITNITKAVYLHSIAINLQ